MDKNQTSSASAPNPTHVAKPRGSSLWVQALGYSVAIGAGVSTVVLTIRDKFYDTASHWPGFRELKNERNARIDKVINDVKNGAEKVDNEAFYKATRVHHDWHNVEHKKLMAKFGFGAEPGAIGFIKDTHKRWRQLGEGKQFAILFSGAVSTGLTIGSFFLLNQNAYLRRELGDLKNSVNNNEQQR